MFKVVILSDQPRLDRNFHDFFSIYKYKNELKTIGISIEILYSIPEVKKKSADIIILANRFFKKNKRQEIFDLIQKLRNLYTKIYWFDLVDTTGSDSFWVIPYVDIFLKKQVLVDKGLYTVNEYDKSIRCWVDFDKLPDKYPHYVPCPPEELHKIQLGWNIGLCDYRMFPNYTGLIRNYFFSQPTFLLPNRNRKLDLVFRGGISYGEKEQISQQRNITLTTISKLKDEYNFILGEKIGTSKYLNELRNSKLSVSPFGWGEVCYRDFESVIAGCLLFKPSMEHMETYPNIYSPNQTYIPLEWTMRDLGEKLEAVLSNFEEYIDIAFNAQNKLKSFINDPSSFVEHFVKITKYHL